LGTWTARRLARPAALRITRIVISTNLSAHQATLIAALTALAAACGFAQGTSAGLLIGAVLLELWYVLDHVDGQLARWRGTASLDGTTLDYLMHHAVNLVVPQAVALGLVRQTGEPLWFVLGTAWSCGLVLVGLRHDARYKAFIQRLKLVEGELRTIGGGGGRPLPASWPRSSLQSWAAWSVQKLVEMHVIAHLLTIVGLVGVGLPNVATWLIPATMVVLAVPAVALAGYFTLRSTVCGEAEAEFAAWHRVPPEATLEFRAGRWVVESLASTTLDESTTMNSREQSRTS
jgi:hypothetical protein